MLASTGVGPAAAAGEERGGSFGDAYGVVEVEVEEADGDVAVLLVLLVLVAVGGFLLCLGDLMDVSALRDAAAADSAGVGSVE